MTAPAPNTPTVDRVLRTFLRLVAERGIEATTTRLLAEEAGVNEVTIFRWPLRPFAAFLRLKSSPITR